MCGRGQLQPQLQPLLQLLGGAPHRAHGPIGRLLRRRGGGLGMGRGRSRGPVAAAAAAAGDLARLLVFQGLGGSARLGGATAGREGQGGGGRGEQRYGLDFCDDVAHRQRVVVVRSRVRAGLVQGLVRAWRDL